MDPLNTSMSQLSLNKRPAVSSFSKMPAALKGHVASYLKNPLSFFSACKEHGSPVVVQGALHGRKDFFKMIYWQEKSNNRFIYLFFQSEIAKQSVGLEGIWKLSPMQKKFDIMHAEANSARNVLTIAQTVLQVANQQGIPVSTEVSDEVSSFMLYVQQRYSEVSLFMQIHNMMMQSIANTIYIG